jgi:hypothetical protein
VQRRCNAAPREPCRDGAMLHPANRTTVLARTTKGRSKAKRRYPRARPPLPALFHVHIRTRHVVAHSTTATSRAEHALALATARTPRGSGRLWGRSQDGGAAEPACGVDQVKSSQVKSITGGRRCRACGVDHSTACWKMVMNAEASCSVWSHTSARPGVIPATMRAASVSFCEMRRA